MKKVKQTLIQKIVHEIQTDDYDESDEAIELFNSMDEETQEQVNQLFTYLTGWKLSTLIKEL